MSKPCSKNHQSRTLSLSVLFQNIPQAVTYNQDYGCAEKNETETYS